MTGRTEKKVDEWATRYVLRCVDGAGAEVKLQRDGEPGQGAAQFALLEAEAAARSLTPQDEPDPRA